MAEMIEKIATREAYGNALAEFGDKYDFVVLDADLAAATKTGVFKKKFPDRFFDCGIAEGNMMTVAAGLAAVQGGTLSITADGDLFKAEVCLPAITDGSADAKIAPAQRTPVDPVSASPASAAPAYTAPAPVNIPVHVKPQTPSPVVSSQPERQEATCDTTAAVAPSAADTAEEAAPAETESAPETADSPADSKADDSADIQ